MEKCISLTKVWDDDDVIELQVTTADGCSCFCVNVYVGHEALKDIIADMERFKTQIHGGIYDLQLGSFGPEFAGGAYKARLHFNPPARGRVCVTVDAEGGWQEFSTSEVATRARLYMTTEPGLLDRFIVDMKALSRGSADSALLQCV